MCYNNPKSSCLFINKEDLNIFFRRMNMDYSLSIKSLCKEISRIKSYSRLNPFLRAVMFILMLPFTIIAATGTVFYYVLLFLRNGSQIGADELEHWLNKRKSGAHFLPEAVLYLVTIPFIFMLRVFVTIFSGFLYITWFEIMAAAFLATLGGIRWQPYLNTVNFDQEYTWSFKHSKKSFNVFALVNIGFILLCILQAVLSDYVKPWLIVLTVFMIYIAYPLMYTKKNLHEMTSDEDILAEATCYAEVACLANYSRAADLINRIPDNETAQELASEYNSFVYVKKTLKAKIGRILMVLLGALIALLVILPPVFNALSDALISSKDLSYTMIANTQEVSVFCTNSATKSVKIKEDVGDYKVTKVADNAFKGYYSLKKVILPSTITAIGNNAFKDCVTLDEIVFDGTMQQWQNIQKGLGWNDGIGANCVVVCTDGSIPVSYGWFY